LFEVLGKNIAGRGQRLFAFADGKAGLPEMSWQPGGQRREERYGVVLDPCSVLDIRMKSISPEKCSKNIAEH
jgi:hypothetical protein